MLLDEKAAFSVVGSGVKSSLKKSVWEDEQKKKLSSHALKKANTGMDTQPRQRRDSYECQQSVRCIVSSIEITIETEEITKRSGHTAAKQTF